MTDFDIAPRPVSPARRRTDKPYPATPTRPGHDLAARRQTRPAFPDLAPPDATFRPAPSVSHRADQRRAQAQVQLDLAQIGTPSPLMRSLVMGVGISLVGAGLIFWLFHNIWLAIAAYAVFGAIGILLTALR